MLGELSDDIVSLIQLIGQGRRFIPVEGRVSDYKSWLAAAAAMELSDDDMNVTMFSPQRANRESGVDKLTYFGANLLEHPSRLDMCIWEPWKDRVGRVDRSTCEAINCPFYVDGEDDIDERAMDAAESHLLETGGSVQMTAEEFRTAGSTDRQNACPAQLYLSLRKTEITDGTVNVATYSKAFQDAAISSDDPLDSDVVLLDEAHTVAANTDVVTHDVKPDMLRSSMTTVVEYLNDQPGRWSNRALEELEGLRNALDHWLAVSRDQHVSPEDPFDADAVSLSDAFSALDRVDSRLTQQMNRANTRGDWTQTERAASPFKASKYVRGFLSRVMSFRDGDADFIHSRYEENGELVNEMAFREAEEEVDIHDGCSPGEIYQEWLESGTHPAIQQRWGPLLDRYIESLWDGRQVRSSEGMPSAPVMPMEKLRRIAGADATVTLSATHNELSDPTRDPDRLRPTRHELLTAPTFLRTGGSGSEMYDGSDSVSPETPWFRSLFSQAKEASGDSVSVVPVNFANRRKWEGLPIETLEVDGEEELGVVPHSRGSIGEKGLEELEIDTVVCGVQVQSPAPTARRLVQWWELLAPRHDDPADVLDKSWRLMAQHAVSGTIQAGGRFDWDATNLVFERPELLRLAGFEARPATPEDDGFAGAYAAAHERKKGSWSDQRDSLRAARVVSYLNDAGGKTASPKQFVGQYTRVYDGADDEGARRALWLASEDGRVESKDAPNGVRFETTS